MVRQKGRVGTPTTLHKIKRPRHTIKAKRAGWCQRCRNRIYPGEWIVVGRFDVHRYKCPDPDQASQDYLKRLAAQQDKQKLKGMIS